MDARPSYGADWGDYISFAEHLRKRADSEGTDLLLIDSGDRIEGNGLYDAAHPKGRYILNIIKEQHIDVLCSGNHELYKNQSSYDEYEITVPEFHGNYLASNIDIIDPNSGQWRPLAQRYKKFKTKNQGIRIVAFGFLYDFSLNSNNTIVQKVEDTIKEEWFHNVIQDRDVDLFLVVGHVPLRTAEFPAIFHAIRQHNLETPIQFFGGHLHIRDYAKYDSNSYGIESGRYMETIGFMSISGIGVAKTPSVFSRTLASLRLGQSQRSLAAALRFGRRYIDNNLFSYHRHTGLNTTAFQTPHGLSVSRQIAKDRAELKLDVVHGCAPQDYFTDRAPFPSNQSIYSWLQAQVLPQKVYDKQRGDRPRLVLTNTGAIRFEIFKGQFTTDTLYTISPFTSGFRFIPDVPFAIAKRLLAVLNAASQIVSTSDSIAFKSPSSPSQEIPTLQYPIDQQLRKELTPGYTTSDDAGTDGDDTLHLPIQKFKIPNCVESRISFPPSSPESVDLVYVDFIEPYILLAIGFLGSNYTKSDTLVFMEGQNFTGIIGEWVKQHWPC